MPICRYGPADRDGDGVPDGYRDETWCRDHPAACFQRDCGRRPAQQTPSEFAAWCHEKRCVIDRSHESNCEWYRNILTPVSEYADFLNGLKRSPDTMITVAAFVGPQQFTPQGDEITYNLPERPRIPACDPNDPAFDPELPIEDCCPGGRCEGPNQPTCVSPVAVAYNGRRYYELAHMYGVNGFGCPRDTLGEPDPFGPCVHICGDDFARGLLRELVARVHAH